MKNKIKKDRLWEENSFMETIDSESMKDKMKTFHMKHNEEMNFNCRKCNKEISAHNKDWYNGMCDACFYREYFDKN